MPPTSAPQPRLMNHHGPAAITLNPESAAYFDALCARWGLRAQRYRASIFLRRQAASLRALRAGSARDGAVALMRDAGAAERALSAVMIGVTSFFRDPRVFSTLRDHVRAMHRGRGPLRVLSIGCSDGSELYSLAILMKEDGLLRGSRLLGIDCRPAAIAKAQEGLYSAQAIEAIPADLRFKYFNPVNRSLQRCGKRQLLRISDRLRAACRWQVADAFTHGLGEDAGKHDVILCRNLAIYLTPAAAGELWSMLVSQLRPGGLLLVGKAERPTPEVRSLLIRRSRCLYQRRGPE